MQSRALEAKDRVLRAAGTLFTIAVLFHNADHVRRGGTSVTTDVFWIGSAAIAIEIAVVYLIFRGHPDAPLAAMIAGFALAAGYVFVHFTPERGWLNDTFLTGQPAVISRVAASLEVAAALVLAFAGVLATRNGARSSGAQPTVAETLRHPVVAAMVIGNAAVFVLSVVGRYA
jgi:hypothetical protein